MARKGQGRVGSSSVMFTDRPRLISLRRKRWEDKLDEDLGRKPSTKPKITLPSLGDWGKNAFDE